MCIRDRSRDKTANVLSLLFYLLGFSATPQNIFFPYRLTYLVNRYLITHNRFETFRIEASIIIAMSFSWGTGILPYSMAGFVDFPNELDVYKRQHDGGMGCSQGTFTTKYIHDRQAFIGSSKTKKGKSNRREGVRRL